MKTTTTKTTRCPRCSTVHTLTSLDRVDDHGRPVPEREAQEVAHEREAYRAKLAQPFELFAGRKTAKPALRALR